MGGKRTVALFGPCDCGGNLWVDLGRAGNPLSEVGQCDVCNAPRRLTSGELSRLGMRLTLGAGEAEWSRRCLSAHRKIKRMRAAHRRQIGAAVQAIGRRDMDNMVLMFALEDAWRALPPGHAKRQAERVMREQGHGEYLDYDAAVVAELAAEQAARVPGDPGGAVCECDDDPIPF